jgi:hypothetical protein
MFSGSVPSNVTASVYYITSVTGTASPVTIQFSATSGSTAIVAAGGAITGAMVYTGQGSFQDDNAMYNGLDNSASNGGNYTSVAKQTQAIANFVNSVVTGIGGNQSAYLFCNQSGQGIIPDFAAALASTGKPIINYEGGADWAESISTGELSTWLNVSYQITTQGQVTSCAGSTKASNGGRLRLIFSIGSPRYRTQHSKRSTPLSGLRMTCAGRTVPRTFSRP